MPQTVVFSRTALPTTQFQGDLDSTLDLFVEHLRGTVTTTLYSAKRGDAPSPPEPRTSINLAGDSVTVDASRGATFHVKAGKELEIKVENLVEGSKLDVFVESPQGSKHSWKYPEGTKEVITPKKASKANTNRNVLDHYSIWMVNGLVVNKHEQVGLVD